MVNLLIINNYEKENNNFNKYNNSASNSSDRDNDLEYK